MGGGGGNNMGNMGGGNNMGSMGGGNMGMSNQGMNMNNMGGGNMGMSNQGGNFDGQGNSGNSQGKSDDDRARMLRELKEDIARQEREANELEASLDPKRKNDDDSQGETKRAKRASDDDSCIKNATSV